MGKFKALFNPPKVKSPPPVSPAVEKIVDTPPEPMPTSATPEVADAGKRAQEAARRRSGRMASIVTGPRGLPEEGLGNILSRPQARNAQLLGNIGG